MHPVVEERGSNSSRVISEVESTRLLKSFILYTLKYKVEEVECTRLLKSAVPISSNSCVITTSPLSALSRSRRDESILYLTIPYYTIPYHTKYHTEDQLSCY